MTNKLKLSNGPSSHGSGWAIVLWHVSWHVTYPWIQSQCWQHGDVDSIAAYIVGIEMTCSDILLPFPTKISAVSPLYKHNGKKEVIEQCLFSFSRCRSICFCSILRQHLEIWWFFLFSLTSTFGKNLKIKTAMNVN